MESNKTVKLFASMLALSVALTGCGGGSTSSSGSSSNPGSTPAPADTPAKPAEPAKPVTLKVFNWGGLDEAMFQKLVAEPTKKKYPHISFEVTNRDKNTKAEGLAASGAELDILIIQSGPVMNQFKAVKLLEDLTPLLKKHNISTDRFEPQYVDAIRKDSGTGLLALPFGSILWATVYNKDIFDRFGVPYPKDGMTWDDAYELAKKVTVNDKGVQYKGLQFQTLHSLASQLSLVVVDAETTKASVNNPNWAKVLDVANKLYSIPGNDNTIVTAAKTRERFLKDKNVAMLTIPDITAFINESKASKDLNWDFAQYPSFKEQPNTFGMIKPDPVFAVGTTGKNKDEAMKVIDLVTSDEVQLAYAKMAGTSPLKNPEMKKQFGADVAELKGKNVAGLFKSQPAAYKMSTEYTDNAQNLLSKKFDERGGKDINTFMRESEEEINKLIQSGGK